MEDDPSTELDRLRTELKMLGAQHRRWRERQPILHERIRQAHAAGMKQAEIADLSGYERDNIRLLTMSPEQREELRARRRKTARPDDDEIGQALDANAELVEQMERTATDPSARVKRARPSRK